MTPSARRRLAVAGLAVLGVVAGGAVAAGAATPSPAPSAERPSPAADDERTAQRDAAKAARRAAKAERRQAPTGPAFVCDPALSHGQNVSAYARSLPKGPGRGRLVSQAARSDCGKTAAPDGD